MAKMPGDWTCPRCGDMVFARNSSCRMCGTAKPSNEPSTSKHQVAHADKKLSDWYCPSCYDLQFGRNVACRRCGTPRPEAEGEPRGGSSDREQSYQEPEVMRTHSRIGREDAHSRRVESYGRHSGSEQVESYARRDELGGHRMHPGQKWGEGESQGQQHKDVRPGDWYCPQCSDLVFGKHDACRRCNTPKPSPRPTEPNRAERAHQTREGDWTCPACGDLQFARNTCCRKCGEPKRGHSSPHAGRGGQGPKMMPGDWHCPNCGDLQFARNTACRMCGAHKEEQRRSRSPFRERRR
mmetsp:Transcript_69984/g.130846  ORF Transcript_69984/g.130846 Transcript_69984/m.130846 type:complete len:295 (+) Transcript_69984:143-1027(+)